MAASFETLPNRIREHRKASGLSMEKLGASVGLSKSMVGLLERGRRRVSDVHMRRIAKVLELAPADLLHLNDNPDALSQEEKDLIDAYRHLNAKGRRIVHNLAKDLRDWRSASDKPLDPTE
jgi:transcriptional regulator with XRE-family HTH domain